MHSKQWLIKLDMLNKINFQQAMKQELRYLRKWMWMEMIKYHKKNGTKDGRIQIFNMMTLNIKFLQHNRNKKFWMYLI